MEPNAYDFWLGEWDCVTEAGKASNVITREYNENVIVERFSIFGDNAWSGMSLSVYNANDSTWRQTWVDQDANYWNFVGGYADGNPSFATVGRVDQDQRFKRMVFSEITADSLFWRWESSPDAAEWTTNMTVSYKRR